ncbi:MAG TPA: hypothetical protein VFZ65_16925 [Planctomycetota bacterium]|nr:hypothetical protein [Planctomycetota bacterium]
MKVLPQILLSCLVAAACSSPPPTVTHAPEVPRLATQHPEADPSRDVFVRADADRSPPVVGEPAPMAEPGRSPPVYRTVVHIVEKPVEREPQPQQQADERGDARSGPTYDSGSDYGGQSDGGGRAPFLPINTVIGAGVGAAVDHNHARGAWIGSSIGFLIDLQQLWH